MKYFLIVLVVLSSCGYNRFVEPLLEEPFMPVVNAGVSELHYLAGSGAIMSDMVVGGVVTSSDSAGNIYKQLYIEDGTGAMALQVGLFDMYVRYPVGTVVSVKLRGLACGYRDGAMVVGGVGNELEYPVGVEVLNSPALVGRCLFSLGDRVDVEPRRVRVGDIGMDMVGSLILVEGFFVDGSVGCYGGLRRFEDYWGGGVDVYTSAYASFAEELLPWGSVELRAVVGSYAGKLQLIVSSTEDVFPRAL